MCFSIPVTNFTITSQCLQLFSLLTRNSPLQHGCRENHNEGTSKGMESTGTVACAMNCWNKGVHWNSLCTDDDATTRAHLANSATLTQVTARKQQRGELPADYPKIKYIPKTPAYIILLLCHSFSFPHPDTLVMYRFLADPGHAIKVFGKDAYREIPTIRK